MEGERLPSLFNGPVVTTPGKSGKCVAEVGIGLFVDDGDVVLPHGALPYARSSHDEPVKVPGTWSRAGWAFASGCRERVPLNPMVPTAERCSVIGRPGFVDEARAVFGNRTTI
jgi:hypothetical protein